MDCSVIPLRNDLFLISTTDVPTLIDPSLDSHTYTNSIKFPSFSIH